MLSFYSQTLGQGPNPINLFSPQAGQTQQIITQSNGSTTADTAIYEVIVANSDSAIFTRNSQEEYSIVFENGILRAPFLLGTMSIDTNGIYDTLMKFPEDFSRGDLAGQRKSGYVLNHRVGNVRFDTLLVTCTYFAFLDAGDVCDFITPSGYLAYWVNNNCFCAGGGYSNSLEEDVLQHIGGTPLSIQIQISKIHQLKPGGKSYNVRGQLLGLSSGSKVFPHFIYSEPAIESGL